jgi:retron-type reverse transcriptase
MDSNTYMWNYSDFEDCGYYLGDTKKMQISSSKRLKNVYHLIYSPNNLIKAQHNAQKGKGRRSEIDNFNNNICQNLNDLWDMLINETYVPGDYRIKTIYEPKERVIMIAPFFPDRIVHHCIINVLGQFWSRLFISNTYACIKGRGIHKCMEDVHKALVTDRNGTKYCLKIDIRKFYDNVDHAALKKIMRCMIADEQLLRLLDKIIDSNGMEKGLPIGNFTSQYLANVYLSYFDHWMKEVLRVKYYYRYMDDIVVLSDSKEKLHQILDAMGLYLGAELKLEIKSNWQIFPVDDRGIDYVGFKQNHFGILLRKGILKRFYMKLRKVQKTYKISNEMDIKHLFPSEYGWIIRCSEDHSKFIFNKCLNDGNKSIKYRTAV